MAFDPLHLDVQLCFPLYAVSREVVKRYKPFLDELGLTYTQYIVLLVLWECRQITAKELGDRLHLDSGTLTPVLKRLEQQGLLQRERSAEDERSLVVTLTEEGAALRSQAVDIPEKLGSCLNLTKQEAATLHSLLTKMLKHF